MHLERVGHKLKTQNWAEQMKAADEKVLNVIEVHSEGHLDACTKFQGNPSNGNWDTHKKKSPVTSPSYDGARKSLGMFRDGIKETCDQWSNLTLAF